MCDDRHKPARDSDKKIYDGQRATNFRHRQTDKRQILVSITETGRELHACIRQKHHEEAQALLSVLSEEEKLTLADLFDKILRTEHNTEKE